MSILLIHGYGMGLKIPGIREHYGLTAGFAAFREDIAAGRAKVFRWDTRRNLAKKDVYRPSVYRSHYLEERAKAAGPETQQALIAELESMQAETVLCHSLGCQLLLNAANAYGLPKSVQRVFFAQADVDRAAQITRPEVRQRLKEGSLAWTNFYCRLDPTLLIAAAYHRRWRAGQIGITDPLIKNAHFHLRKWPNLHMSSLRDQTFRSLIVAQ